MIDLKTLDEVVQELINAIHDKLPQVDTKEGTFIRDVFIDPISDELVGLNMDMKILEYAQSILTATGEDLDRLAQNYNVIRKSAQPSTGFIRFYIKRTDVDFIIKANTQLATKATTATEAKVFKTSNTKDIYYIYDINDPPFELNSDEIKNLYTIITINNLSIASNGYYYYDVDSESIEGGSLYNVASETIINTVDNVDSNIQFFINPSAFTGGTDQESDANLTLRIKLALQGANIGTKYGYLSYILENDNVIDAQVVAAMDDDMIRDLNENGVHDGGKVDIYVRGSDLEDNVIEQKLTSDLMYTEEGEIYSYLSLSKEDKPISNIVSINYVTDEGMGTLTNVNDYEQEFNNSEFINVDDELLNTDNTEVKPYQYEFIMNVINTIESSSSHMVATRHSDVPNFIYTNNLKTSSEYRYVESTNDIGQETITNQPVDYIIYKDELGQIFSAEFIFYVNNVEVDHYLIVKNDKDGIPDTSEYDYNIYRDYKKSPLYYKDELITTDVLFLDVNNIDGEVEYDPNISYLVKKYGISEYDFYNYTTLTPVYNSLLTNMTYLRTNLKEYKYDLDLGLADLVEKEAEALPYLYSKIEEENNDVSIKLKINNIKNMLTIKFDVVIDNSNYYLDLFQNNNGFMPVDGTIPTSESDWETIVSKTFEYTMSNSNEQIIILDTLNFIKGLDTNFTLTFNNVLIKNENDDVFTYTTHKNIFSSGEEIDPVYDEDITNILYYMTEYHIRESMYKVDITLPILLENGTIVNVPISIVKKNDNLYLRTYYTPDFELIKKNENMFGNSQETIYRLHWFTNPIDLINGNVYLYINTQKNLLIQELQSGIERIKCLTADVLIKEAVEYPIEIIANIKYDDTYDISDTRSKIDYELSKYINSLVLGTTLKLSDLIIIIQDIEGVSYVESSSLELRRLYDESVKMIKLHAYEYFKLSNLVINEIYD